MLPPPEAMGTSMSGDQRIDSTVLKFVALVMADGLTGPRGSDLPWTGRELQEMVGRFISEDEFLLAEAMCRDLIFRTVLLLPEFSGDVIEARSKNGDEGMRDALKELKCELREEIVRSLRRTFD
jgi:hypothetical protein